MPLIASADTFKFRRRFGPEGCAFVRGLRDSAVSNALNRSENIRHCYYARNNAFNNRTVCLGSGPRNLHTEEDDTFDPEEMERYLAGSAEPEPEELPEEQPPARRRKGPDLSEYFVTTKPWEPGDDLRHPYMMPREEMKLSLDRWPENSFLRIKLYSYYKHLANLAVQRIKLGLRDNENLRVTNPMALPMRRKRWCHLSSAFIDKRSKDLIEIEEHVRVVDVVPVNTEAPRDFKGLLMVPIPDFVSFDYWFEEAHKPVKSRKIHDLFRERRWVSKYLRYHRDKHRKRELIERLTSPELVGEIPLRWKRPFKADYFFLQLGELRKLYRTVVARKAEDDARRFYNVPTPEIFDFGDVRFVGTLEDRRFDPDYSAVDHK